MKWLIAKLFGNIGKVNGDIWRSGQSWILYPIWLCLGLKTIINVATSPDDPQDPFEERFCRWFKIKYYHFDNLGPKYNFRAVYHTLLDCKKPCLVHCERGKDRTGGLIAYYKLKEMNADYSDIIRDWMIHGIPDEGWLKFIFNAFPM